MKTIDERIDASVADLFFEKQITALVVATTLKKHFAEPWLDEPEGPGWWWSKTEDELDPVFVGGTTDSRKIFLPCKWQRAIGPS